MSRWPGPQGLVGTVQRILSDGVPSVTADDLDIGGSDFVASGDVVPIETHGLTSDTAFTTSNTSYTDAGEATSPTVAGDLPSGVTMVGRYVATLKIADSAQTATSRPNVMDPLTRTPLTELEISTQSTGLTLVDSGWTEITTTIPAPAFVEHFELKSSDGATNATLDSRYGCGLLFGIQL